MNTVYLALLRGVNVGGKNIVKMGELRMALEKAGIENVQTYIQSGNIIFSSPQTDTQKLAAQIEKVIAATFGIDARAVVFSKAEWHAIMKAAPKDWGTDPDWKHNLLIMLKPYDMKKTVAAYGVLKPGIEKMVAGKGILYQSLSWTDFGKTTGGKIAGNPIYKVMTIRNYNTAARLQAILDSTTG